MHSPEMRAWRSPQRLVILAGYILGAGALSYFPEEVPPSLRFDGGGTVWLGGLMVAFLLPTAALVIDLLLRGLCVRHPVDEPGATGVLAIYDAIMLRFSLFVTAVHGAVLLAVLGLVVERPWVATIVPLMLGFTLISIGNLLPRTRPNLAIGIRTHGTLSDRAQWIRTHRAAGYMTVACGVVTVLSAITLPSPLGPLMILLAGPAALVGMWLLTPASRGAQPTPASRP